MEIDTLKKFLLIIFLVLLLIFLGKISTDYSPLSILPLGVCLLLFVLTFINPDLGLLILIFSMLLSPEIHMANLPKREVIIRLEDFLLIVITFGWFARTAVNHKLKLIAKTPLNKPIGAYLLVCFIATINGVLNDNVNIVKGFFYVLRYTEYFLLYFMVANNIRDKKQIKIFITAFLIICAIICIYAALNIGRGIRVSAPFEGEGEPNTLGGYLVFLFAVAMGMAVYINNNKFKFMFIGLSSFIIVPFLYTLSRASYMAIIAVYLSLLMFSGKKVLLFVFLAVSVILLYFFLPDVVKKRIQNTFIPEREFQVKIGRVALGPSPSARIISWKEKLIAWRKKPILGYGVTGIGFVDGQYILTIVETGILGFLAFMWLIWAIFKRSLEVYIAEEDKFLKGISLGFICGFIGLLVHALTANTFIIVRIMEPFCFIAALVMMLPELHRREYASG